MSLGGGCMEQAVLKSEASSQHEMRALSVVPIETDRRGESVAPTIADRRDETIAPSWIGGWKLSVVIPAKNEADNLPMVLPRIPSWVHQVVLVDGHSTDNTVDVALALRPDIHVVM